MLIFILWRRGAGETFFIMDFLDSGKILMGTFFKFSYREQWILLGYLLDLGIFTPMGMSYF